ncbi:DCL family protein [Streptomyces sp. NBC_00162]|uniref:DCL family protein n=1 Tax=Streptomyces sp. NBC_00162 TaxID=2903629 RepID=UPI00214CBC3C|nr:DCL family protein [Streptomyces sp. NBC_00162]UUU45114.1 DCL family protein [Streptomyces sp. NBC_00162]
MATAFTINGEYFPTKKAAEQRIRGMIKAYRFGSQVSAQDDEFLRDLITRHPDHEDKAGTGVAGFRVDRSEFGNRCLMVLRTDGTEIDISWPECLKPTSHAQQVRGCLRRAISDQVIAKRDEAFAAGPVVCEVTNLVMLTPDEADVDHAAPKFKELAETFILQRGGLEAFVIAPDRASGMSYAELQDDVLVAAWQQYHREHATLRVITKHANRSVLQRKGQGAV